MVAADSLKRLILKKRQQLGLQLKRHIADFVEQERAPVGRFHSTYPIGHGASKGPFGVAKQFRFDQFLGERSAVHDPMYCFAGAGYKVISDLPMTVEGGVARCLFISQGGKRSRIVYWFSNGESRHSSILAYWFNTTIRRITFGLSGPEPVLVIVQCDEERDSLTQLRKFRPLFDV